MKPFIWITALVLSLPFLGGAAFTAYDALGRQDILTNPESKVAVGWLFTGLMFLAMGVRGGSCIGGGLTRITRAARGGHPDPSDNFQFAIFNYQLASALPRALQLFPHLAHE